MAIVIAQTVETINTSQSQYEFVKAMNEKFNSMLSSQIDGEFLMMNSPSGFHWYYQYGNYGYFNINSMREINSSANIEKDTGILRLVPTNLFSSLYYTILRNVDYLISRSDRDNCDAEAKRAGKLIDSLKKNWENSDGPITDAKMTAAGITNKDPVAYICKQVKSRWNGDYTKATDDGFSPEFVTNYREWKNACRVSQRIFDIQADGLSELEAAKSNTFSPDDKNGGLKMEDGSYSLAYKGMDLPSEIDDSLNSNRGGSITLSFHSFNSTSSSLNIGGSANISVPIADILSISFKGAAEYNLSKYASSDLSLDVEMIYKGLTPIGMYPLASSTDRKTGWYDEQILTEIIENDVKEKESVTGFRVDGSEVKVSDWFGIGKKFARIKTLVICQPPTIKMKFKSSQLDDIRSHFNENAEASVKLLGFDIGINGSESYEITHVDTTTASGEITITLEPPQSTVTPAPQDRKAYMLGGVISYPPETKIDLVSEKIKLKIESDEELRLQIQNAVKIAVEKELVDAHVIKTGELTSDLLFKNRLMSLVTAPKTQCKCS